MGRLLEKFTNGVMNDLSSGRYATDEIMPAIRKLADQHGVSRNTVQLGLQELVAKGYLTLIPRVGYRVKTVITEKPKSGLIAYVAFDIKISDGKSLFLPFFMDGLRYYGDRLAFSVVNVSTNQKSFQDIINELIQMNVTGVIISSYYKELVQELMKHKYPLVMVDSFIQDLNVNTIIQDNFMGGYLAAKWVLKNQFEDIIWLGPQNNSLHALERFGGFVSGLTLKEVTLKPKNIINAEDDVNMIDNYMKKLRKCLENSTRPVVIVSLWTNLTISSYQLIKEMGLKYKKDVFIIGWCIEEMVDLKFKPVFSKFDMPVYISWSCKQIASMTIDHFTNKVNSLKHEAVRKTVPVSLVEP